MVKLIPKRFGWFAVMLAAVACAGSCAAQGTSDRPWQRLQMPTVAEVRATWVKPPAEYGPEPYYGLNGAVTIENVRQDLDTMARLGFRAVTVQYGFGSTREYLSPEYLSFFRQFVLEAKQRGLRVWIVDDAGYPSGFAGGWFTAKHPELRMQALVVASRTAVTAGGSFDQEVPADTVAVTALRSDGQASVAVPFAGGRARWTAPEGEWSVAVVEHAFRTSPTRSDTNPKRVKDGSQSLEDYLDPAATAEFLRVTHDAYARVVGDEFGKTILGFRGDEPDYSISGLPWTPALFVRFAREEGYDVRPYLAALLPPKGAVLTSEQMRVRADYFDVFAAMFRDGFFKPQGEWCAAHGLEYQVHLNHEEQELALARSEGDFFRDMKYVQVPGIDTIWHQIWTDTVSDFPRLASSAAHVYGHPRAFTESFAAYRPLPDVGMARYILNEQFARRVNLVEAMYFPASSSPGGGGPMPFMRDAAWPGLMRYVSRVSYVMSMGRPAAEVALLLPAESLWMGDAAADNTFVTAERLLSERQVDFDVVGEDAIAAELRSGKGAFVSGSGNRYRTVIVPDADLLRGTVVERLRVFAKSGGRVVFLGKAPEFVAGEDDLHARQVGPEAFAWATVLPGELPVTPTPPMQPPAAPPEPLVVPEGMEKDLMASVPEQALRLERPDSAIRYTRRVLKDGEVFFVFNEGAKALDDALVLHVAGHKVELWDADLGQVREVSEAIWDPKRGDVRVPVSMAPYGVEVLVVR